VHTGQHYDPEMSGVFFQELGIPTPDHNLAVGSGSHAAQTSGMIRLLEPVLIAERPDWVLLYGDTNSTLAGALVASKLGMRTAHVEAGLRSFNRSMPEELNRVVTDHLSDLLLCPTSAAMNNLRREGLDHRAVVTGDVMYDAMLVGAERAEQQEGPLTRDWLSGTFALATVHRAENTNDHRRLRAILNGLEQVAAEICPVVLPLHPRTRKAAAEIGWTPHNVRAIRPISYLEMLLLERRARLILTDSGGVQKEAYFARVPCVTLRDETEWVETLEGGCNTLAGANEHRIIEAARATANAGPWTAIYGTGNAGGVIVEKLTAHAVSE
jgi:UDP-GlcNAc3NAcA epimerase